VWTLTRQLDRRRWCLEEPTLGVLKLVQGEPPVSSQPTGGPGDGKVEKPALVRISQTRKPPGRVGQPECLYPPE